MIASAEASVSDASGGAAKGSPSSSSSQLSVLVRQFVNELEGPSVDYVALFGPETTMLARNVLLAAARAKAELRLSQLREHQAGAAQAGRLGFVGRLRQWLAAPAAGAGGEDNGEEISKTLNHLEQASNQLAEFFNVPYPAPHSFSLFSPNVQVVRVKKNHRKSHFLR